jgi:Secretion system C-terminal sorting domain/Carboxylesterase family
MRKLAFLLFCFTIYATAQLDAQCSDGRYYNSIFGTINTSTTIYGNAVLYNGVDTNLRVDIYQPGGDTLSQRPLLIFAFGGSFVSGLRQSPDLVILCNYFAARGYVCASIDYRLGYYGGGTDTNLFTAMIRGIQDMKAAVRFFHKDALTSNTYRIDTNQIFIGGVSAGAFIALNYAYWNFSFFSKAPPGFVIPVLDSVGGLDGNSGNPGYSQNIKGVIDLCGGIADTIWLTPGTPLLVGVHGTADNTVACSYDSAYAVTNTKSMLFGGCDIKTRLSHISTPDSFYIFQGADHCPFIIPYAPTYNPVPWMDTTEWIVRDFLVKHITCPPVASGINSPEAEIPVSIYPNPSEDIISVNSQYLKELQVSVLTLDGKQVQQYTLPGNSTLSLHKKDLSAGVYLLQFSEKGGNQKLRTDKIIFY